MRTITCRRKAMRRLQRLIVAGVFAFLVSAATHAQGTGPAAPATPTGDQLSGNYEGVAKRSDSSEMRVTLEIKSENGKLSGKLLAQQRELPITEGTFVEGKLALRVGAADTHDTFVARAEGDKLTGELTTAGEKHTVELTKIVTPKAEEFSLTGDWDAVADAQGQAFPFALSIKVDGEKVSGEGSSSLGISQIIGGTWKDGKLSIELLTSNGGIVMSATVKDGGLAVEFDYAGQLQGRWVATKRTP